MFTTGSHKVEQASEIWIYIRGADMIWASSAEQLISVDQTHAQYSHYPPGNHHASHF